MKPFDTLTRRGRLRRLRDLATMALHEYGLAGARLTFVHYEGNAIFRVDAPGSARTRGTGAPYVPGRCNLRILTTSNKKAIASELTWLAALRQGSDLPVPEPIPASDGRLLITLATSGVPNGRHVSLMRWVDGTHLSLKSLRPHHVEAWGHLMARLHDFAARWRPPKGFERNHWDWDGLLGERVLRTPTGELTAMMPVRYREAFETISRELRETMATLGKGPDVYGMIHTDMYLENILFKAGTPRVIDFEDCGFGYWMFDIGIVLSQWLWSPEFPWIRDSFLTGYTKIRPLPNEQLRHLDLFMAARYADLTLWGTYFIRREPAMRVQHEEWRNKAGDDLARFVERR